jgi:hypothetical protein
LAAQFLEDVRPRTLVRQWRWCWQGSLVACVGFEILSLSSPDGPRMTACLKLGDRTGLPPEIAMDGSQKAAVLR